MTTENEWLHGKDIVDCDECGYKGISLQYPHEGKILCLLCYHKVTNVCVMRPETYREQSACINCRHVFIFMESDDTRILYCHQDGSDRPPCGSVLMDETFTGDEEEYLGWKKQREGYRFREERWSGWTWGRAVAANGICDKHEEASDD